MSWAGFRGGFESRTICPRGRRPSSDATTEEVPRRADPARCAAGDRVRPAGRVRRARHRPPVGDVAQAGATGGGRWWPEAWSPDHGGAGGDQAVAQGSVRAAPRERDPEGIERVFATE